MNEFTNMYSYLKVISETTTDQAASECPFSAKRFILYIYIYILMKIGKSEKRMNLILLISIAVQLLDDKTGNIF